MDSLKTSLIIISVLLQCYRGCSSDSKTKIYLGDTGIQADIKHPHGQLNLPYYDPAISTNVTAEVGKTAFLPCIVRQIGSKTVSWVRKRDSAILSIGDYVFASSDRIGVEVTPYLNQWALIIRNVERSESGEYECQVSTEPKMSKIFHLYVQVPKLHIEGAPEIFTKEGSDVRLNCSVKGSAEEWDISWYFRKKDDIAFRKLPSDKKGVWLLNSVEASHGGEYMCTAQNLVAVYAQMIVLPGERVPEPMLKEKIVTPRSVGGGSSSVSRPHHLAFWFMSLFKLCL